VEDLAVLVTRVQAGDTDAFNALVRRFQDVAVGYGYALLGDFHLAQDAAQEAFLTAWREARRLREPAAFPGWFRQIVFTQCRRLTRRKTLDLVPLDETQVVGASRTDPATVIERKVWISSEVAALSENERVVLALFYVGGYSNAEISAFLELPLNTVKSRLHRARKRLRSRMIEMSEKLLAEELSAQRPSHREDFAHRVMALLRAAAAGDERQVSQLLEQSSAEAKELVNAAAPHPYWGGEPGALHVAAEAGRAEVVELLLRQGADPNARGEAYDHWSPLHCVIHRAQQSAAHQRALELMLAHGAALDIWAAAMLGDAERVSRLLAQDATLAEACGPNGATPLHFAATVEVAEILVAAGAGLRTQDKYGKAPVYTLVGYGEHRFTVARRLCEQTGAMDIFIASALGEAERVATWLEAHPELLHTPCATGQPGDGWKSETLLNIAALHGQTEIIRLLLRHGADVNRQAPSGCCALHLAAGGGQMAAAQLLIEQGAAVNPRDRQYQATPLGWAEFQGQQDMMKFLRECGGKLAGE